MDPYKVLGVSQSNIKHEKDLIPARERAKTLFKRYQAEKKKFDAKKVLEAFEMIKHNLKGKVGEGQYKLIGRSRKERELDKHFNHQTKEIKGDKGLKRALKDAQMGEKRMRLRGEKERVARPRRGRGRRHQKNKKKTKKHVDSLQGLQKLSVFLESEKKFPKAIPLLNRWVREYMNQDNRVDVFEVLHKLSNAEWLTENADSRQEVVQVYEYVMGYFSAWFEEGENNKMLRASWRVAAVLACQCFTDDAFMLSRTIVALNEALTLLETNKDLIEEGLQLDGSPEDLPRGLPTPPGSPTGSPPVGSPSFSDAANNDEEEQMEFYPTPTPSDDEAEEEVKVEVKEEFLKVEIKEEKLLKDEKGLKEEVKTEDKKAGGKKQPAAVEISLDSDDDVVQDLDKDMIVDSEDSVHDIDSGAEDDDEVYESLSSGVCSSSDVEHVDTSFKAPAIPVSLRTTSEYFVHRCLGTLFAQRGPQWARPKIDAFFQDVFYRRSIFSPAQQSQVEAWQARIKVLQKGSEHGVADVNANSNPLESHRPVIDSRETRQSIDCASSAWSAKQTFDSRDRCGGSGVIR